MAVESTADRAAFFNIAEFGQVATVTIAAVPVTVAGILTTAFAAALDELDAPVESSRPVFVCRSGDVVGVDHDDPVAVNSTNYIVTGIEPDSDGIVRLLMQEV